VTPTTVDSRAATALLDFQMWCWGQDIVHPAGNVLSAHAVRWRPEGGRGSSHYRVSLGESRTLVLWGFAVMIDAASSPLVVLRRHGFAPRVLDRGRLRWPVTRPEELPRGAPPRTAPDRLAVATALADVATWVAGYEQDVRALLGPTWRRECARRRPRQLRHRLPCDPDALGEAWDALAQAHRLTSPPVS